MTHEPPKLKTTLKTPPKQATNPLQFVKVGPCSLYRTAQEQLQKVQEVKKIKQEVRDDPEDWQSVRFQKYFCFNKREKYSDFDYSLFVNLLEIKIIIWIIYMLYYISLFYLKIFLKN